MELETFAAMRRFLNGLRDLVLRETAAQRQQIHSQWQKPIAVRTAEGHAIENVRLVEIRRSGQVALSCTRNQSRFRPGDVLCLSQNDPFAPEAVMVSLDEDEETNLIVSGEPAIPWEMFFANKTGWTLDEGFIDMSGYILGALAEAGDTLVGRTRILPLLMGERRPEIDPHLYARGLEMGEALGLNWSQSEALANGYATNLAYLVQGPPGTGKTRVLATLAHALAGQKYIFFGDQQQLPPVLTTRLTGGALRDSVFGYLAEGNFDTMLTETYRLNAELTAWPSQHFYEGQLTAAPHVAQRRLNYPQPPTRLAGILDPDAPKIFWDMGHHNNTVYSQKEAYAVVDLITTLLECGLPAAEIGVVAPYRAQGRLIRNLLREYVPETAVRRDLVTDTVERMQGQERDVIILSLTTSNPGFAAHVAEFFFQPQRLNVAVTRPRKKLIIVGSRFVLNAQPFTPELQETVALLDSLLQSCVYISLRHETKPQVWENPW